MPSLYTWATKVLRRELVVSSSNPEALVALSEGDCGATCGDARQQPRRRGHTLLADHLELFERCSRADRRAGM